MAVDTKAVATAIRVQADLLDPPASPVTPTTPAPATPPATFTDLPNFKLLRGQAFDKPCAEGKFLETHPDMGAYDTGWSDTSNRGRYRTDNLSVVDGRLRIHCCTKSGMPGGSVPNFKGLKGEGQLNVLHGRSEVAMWCDPVSGYKVAHLWWPGSDNWDDGEIDWAEGSLNGSASAYNHLPGSPRDQDGFEKTGAKLSERQVYAVEWTPSSVRFLLDGREVGRSAKVPSKPMHHVLQTETNIGGTAPKSSDDGYVYIDGYAIWQYVK